MFQKPSDEGSRIFNWYRVMRDVKPRDEDGMVVGRSALGIHIHFVEVVIRCLCGGLHHLHGKGSLEDTSRYGADKAVRVSLRGVRPYTDLGVMCPGYVWRTEGIRVLSRADVYQSGNDPPAMAVLDCIGITGLAHGKEIKSLVLRQTEIPGRISLQGMLEHTENVLCRSLHMGGNAEAMVLV